MFHPFDSEPQEHAELIPAGSRQQIKINKRWLAVQIVVRVRESDINDGDSTAALSPVHLWPSWLAPIRLARPPTNWGGGAE